MSERKATFDIALNAIWRVQNDFNSATAFGHNIAAIALPDLFVLLALANATVKSEDLDTVLARIANAGKAGPEERS